MQVRVLQMPYSTGSFTLTTCPYGIAILSYLTLEACWKDAEGFAATLPQSLMGLSWNACFFASVNGLPNGPVLVFVSCVTTWKVSAHVSLQNGQQTEYVCSCSIAMK